MQYLYYFFGLNINPQLSKSKSTDIFPFSDKKRMKNQKGKLWQERKHVVLDLSIKRNWEKNHV